MATIRSILVATDFSPEASWALRRAAMILGATGARGVVAHVLSGLLPAQVRPAVASRAESGLAAIREEAARGGARFETALACGNIAEELARMAEGHDLVVAGARGAGLLPDFPFGRTARRLVRRSPVPVLVVKASPSGPYERALVAVDFTKASRAALELGRGLAPDAALRLVHAYEVEFESNLRLGGASDETVEAYRGEARRAAWERMRGLLQELWGGRSPPETTIEHGRPAKVVLETAGRTGAQLIAAGKHGAGLVERLVIGSIALQLLEGAGCDVLVVPGE